VNAPVIPAANKIAVEQAWEAYRAVLLRHRDDLSKWDDADRVRERADAYQRFEQIFESMP